MANDENTAVNDLIARVANRSFGRTPTSPHPAIGQETLPASPRALANGSAASPLGPEELHATLPRSTPSAAPFDASATFDGAATRELGASLSGIPAWSRRGDSGEHLIGTMRVSQRADTSPVARRLLVPIVAGLVLVGVLVGALISIANKPRASSPAALPARPSVSPAVSAIAPPAVSAIAPPAVSAIATPAAPLPTAPPPTIASPPPTIAPPPATTAAPAAARAPGSPALIDVRIDSVPSGATVTLIDRGKTQLVGNTPVAAAIDPTRDYDLMFAYAGRPTKVEHLDPRITQRIAVTLDTSAPAIAPSPTPPPARRSEPAPRRTVAEAPRRSEPARGEGTLMISSKPPCEILIDGKPTGLTTPQRAIALPAGRHKVTLVNSDKDIQRTLSVQITPNATEKVIEDLMR